MKFVFFRFRRTEKMDSVTKGQMGQCPPPRILGLESPLYTYLTHTLTDTKTKNDRLAAVRQKSE